MRERLPRVLRKLTIRLAGAVLLVLAAGLICATLVRFAPGFGTDERELDSRLSNDSVQSLRAERESERSVARYYVSYVGGLLHGDLGVSHEFAQPVSQLLKERLPVTLQNIALGLALGWLAAMVLAWAAVAVQNAFADVALSFFAGALISLPAAVVALFIAVGRKPASFAVALSLAPVLYRYARNILQRSCSGTWITAARARGLGRTQIMFRHVLPFAAPQMIALAGVSVNMAFGAALPIEVVADSPGVGQLAWQAALGRDLPLLITLTAFVAMLTMLSNAGAAFINEAIQPRQA